jgi:hypothetical protein
MSMNKPAPILILSATVALFIIGVHQTITLGFAYSYWIFMLTISLLFLYKLMKPKDSSSNK